MNDKEYDALIDEPSSIGKILDAEFKQVIDILKLMIKNNKSFDVAVYETAQKYDVTESTIRDACTRRLKLSTKNFKNITKYPEDLIQLLKEKFPERTKEINDIFN